MVHIRPINPKARKRITQLSDISLHNRANQPKYRLGIYSDHRGFSSILFSFNSGYYEILKVWGKSGVVSINEGVEKTLELLEGLDFKTVWGYMNDNYPVLATLKKQNEGRVERFFTSSLDESIGIQIIGTLLKNQRLILSEGDISLWEIFNGEDSDTVHFFNAFLVSVSYIESLNYL